MDDAVQPLSALGDVGVRGGGERQQRIAAAARQAGYDSDGVFDRAAPAAAHSGSRGGDGPRRRRRRLRDETGRRPVVPRAPFVLQLRSAFARARRW